MNRRDLAWEAVVEDGGFDVAILGGGMNGCCLYDRLSRLGYRTLLVDSSDFASGTSQHSGMMVWGGLLYLKNLDFRTVFRLCASRDSMIHDLPRWVEAKCFRYLPAVTAGRSMALMRAALSLYWLIGLGRRRLPVSVPKYVEQDLLKPGVVRGSLLYEEAVLRGSDSQFCFSWLEPQRAPSHVSLNYCTANGEYSPAAKAWQLTLTDRWTGKSRACSAQMVLNCGGVWTDRINESFGIQTPFRHALSKGVYVNFRRLPEHELPLVFELGENDDTITMVPWGPVAMWGPTETAVESLEEGFRILPQDVSYLLEHHQRRFKAAIAKRDIVSLRCGVRPLVVDRDFRAGVYPLELSRRQRVVLDKDRPWVSCYGGKITDCRGMADRAVRIVAQHVLPTARYSQIAPEVIPVSRFAGLDESVADAAWCRANGYCCTLEDYLRRRTNISQWIPREGLGAAGAGVPAIRSAAMALFGNEGRAASELEAHENRVRNDFDIILRGA